MLCSAGTCAMCLPKRIAFKVKEAGLPEDPGEGRAYDLMNDEVVIRFLPVPKSELPPFTPEQLEAKALKYLRDTAKTARHSYRNTYWEYTTNGVMSNDLEEAADILATSHGRGYNEAVEHVLSFIDLEVAGLHRIGTPSHVNRARLLEKLMERIRNFKKETS